MRIATGTLVATLLLLASTQAMANGCIVVRPAGNLQIDPHGMMEDRVGRWDFDVSYRYLFSDRHFRGTHQEHHRKIEESDVRNSVHTTIFAWTYQYDQNKRITVSVPWVDARRSSLYEHDRVNRYTMSAKGIGDARIVMYNEFLSPEPDKPRAMTFGWGVKLPTGDDEVKDIAYRTTGPELRNVDQSIQLGDGGLGFVVELQGYRQMFTERTFGFFNASYLINPMDTNGVETHRRRDNESIMSVPDQYQFRIGLSHKPELLKNINVELALLAEGVPVQDIVGRSNGFRRPGYSVMIEPGISYAKGDHTFNFSVPYAIQRNRRQSLQDKETGRHGDAAFADYLIQMSYGYNF